MVDTHGHSTKSTSEVGSRSFEIYNNNFYTNFKKGNAYAAIGIRGGDGVIYNNKISSEKLIRTVSLLLEDASFCPKKESLKCNTKSLFIWNNEYNKKYENWKMFRNPATGIKLENGICSECPSKIKKGKHFFLYKPKYYKPYTYPHPLRINRL